MMGKILYTLVIVAILALVVTIGFQVYSILTVERTGPPAEVVSEAPPVNVSAAEAVPQATPAPAVDAVAPASPAQPVTVASAEPVAPQAAPVAPAPAVTAPGEAATPPSSVAAQGTVIGKVEYATGAVSAVGTGGESRSLTVGSEVFLNDKLACGAESKAKVALKDGTVISVGEASEVVLDEYVYTPGDNTKASCVMRFIKGACHLVTGAITALNPDGFKMRARMATVGIRGCEVGVRGDDAKQDILVLSLGAKETVQVDAAEDGSPIMNADTGEVIKPLQGMMKTVNVTEQGFAVSIIAGKGMQMRRIEGEEIKTFMRDTSNMAPAQYDLQQRSDGAVIVVQPGDEDLPGTQE